MELTTTLFWALLIVFLEFYEPEEFTITHQLLDTPQRQLEPEYDYIIVGAGTAGCTIANRLAEDPNANILLIEAGDDGSFKTNIPLYYWKLRKSELDWNYTTVRQKSICLNTGGICDYPRGRALGGCSTINGMAYVRGNKADYDKWAELGNPGWSFDDILPYFIKAENATEPDLAASPYHGTNGPVNVEYARYKGKLREEYIKAGLELGWEHKDFNGESQNNAIDYNQLNIKGNLRDSDSVAYLNPIKHKKNLTIIKKSLVIQIIFDKKKMIATGVKYIRNNKIYQVKTKREVILSAGSVNTPQLLMLSGIGPKNELKKHKIPVLLDLPVGKNLRDHVALTIEFQISKNVTITSDVWKTDKSILEYTKYKRGPLTTTGIEAIAFINPKNSNKIASAEYLFDSFNVEFDKPQHKQIIVITIAYLDTKSIGDIKLKSNNPLDYPLINPNLFGNQSDYQNLFDAVKVALKYMKTKTMKKYSPKLYLNDQPNCKKIKNESKLIKCLIEQYGVPFFHPIGTVKMGPENDDNSVVAPNLLVKGILNLRIVDASIMPTLPRANTNAPVNMVAEKAADIIKNDPIMPDRLIG